MDLKEILLLLEKFQDSDLTQLKVQLSGDLFEAKRGQDYSEESYVKQETAAKKSFVRTQPETTTEKEEPSTTLEESLEGLIQVNAPLVGTFYARPGEDEDPFVNLGDTVKKGQVLCILEAMKVMNEIKSPCDGVVRKIHMKDGEAVDFGKTMFLLEEV
ncbi:acetyl-CoA carboxylase biotin carboxyl carrier protein [Proteiniclasticum ruminis]|uniref:Biotin carboxyl carrier protein of acetyl-CoA carboxylase n=1 Tax=Proteiniclasticum ruminis TaxID=398199 RepID=A0A1G8NRM0_9CLOT|nr:acetyl-CoA carboxylase biotin carboxyl carrier protein [Proteiniclasticum ruminis]SDI82797.1 acetyl-CoA carboxylase biotin carboxyl carrier protein [Proteiniclasticum ruminis]